MTCSSVCANRSCTAVEWSQIGLEDRLSLAKAVRSRIYGPGEILFRQGEENNGLFCFQSGLAGLRRSDGNGNSAILRLIRPGDVVGYPAFLGRRTHPNTAEILVPSKICFIEASQLRWVLKRNPGLTESLLQRVLADLDRTEINCASLLTAGLRGRLLHLLLSFYESYGERLAEGICAVELPVQRKDLAALLGAKPESVSRLISRLDEEGIVRFEGRRVTFPDLESLLTEVSSFS